MDDYIDVRFERVERALASLVESRMTFKTPTESLVKVFVCWDMELADHSIRETLTSLASTRRDITTTHITVDQDGPHHRIKYDELLNFARRISKTTLPPAGVTNGLVMESDHPSGEQPPSAVNGIQSGATSAAPTPTAQSQQVSQTTDQPGPNGVSSSQLPSEPPTTQHTGVASPSGGSTTRTTLPDGLRNVLDPNFGVHFIPWPNEYQIGGGGLAAVQELAERGIDPKGYDPEAVAAEKRRLEEEERAAREEQERRKREEDKRRREEWEANAARRQAMDAQRRESAAESGAGTSAGSQPKKTQFQFTSMDMDDDDDDDDD
ncbi:hypothetical protein ACRALDRAFT_205846 [Sodiomyces alcalophilus JCM 7366]|uniref:uncharacterized protein n=1 Tax=Sodiomyces alcalophilus JCM 7366 TaxID=591952 RepID=UPI0039B4E2DB